MKEQWTKDLQEKMNGYEVPTIPEGLWDSIDATLEECAPQAPAVAKKTALTPHWRKVAAVLLLLLIPTAMYFLYNKEDEAIVAEIEKKAKTSRNAVPTTPTTRETESTTEKNDGLEYSQQTVMTMSCNSQEKEEVTDGERIVQPSESQETTYTQQTKTQSTHKETTTEFDREEVLQTKNRTSGRMFLAMNASGINISGMNNPGTNYQYAMDSFPKDSTYMTEGPEDNPYPTEYVSEKHHRPISIGLQIGLPVTGSLTLATGLTYTYLHSEIDTQAQHTDQQLHFIGVPVQMNYQIFSNRSCAIYLGAGGRVDFGVSGKANDDRLSHLPVNYSLKASSGIQLRLMKSLNAYAEPSIQYNIPGSTRYKTYFTAHKTMFDLQVGIRFTP